MWKFILFSFFIFIIKLSVYGKCIFGFFFDSFSLMFMLLTLVLYYLIYKFLPSLSMSFMNFYKIILFISLFMLLSFFVSSDFIYFFFFFELSMMPLFLLIICWGSNPERLEASFYFFMYTIIGGLPLLFCMTYFSLSCFSLNFYILTYFSFFFYSSDSLFLILFLILSFLIKMPIFGLHYWLPKAHVEAPVTGSVLLASLMLKMGSYGLYRLFFLGYMYNNYIHYMMCIWMLVGKFMMGLMVFRYSDLKLIMAYSSIIHMSLTYISLCFFNYISYSGFVYLLVSHGFISGFLFYIVGYFYFFTSSRSIFINNGWYFYSLIFIYMILFCSFKMSFPPFMSFFSEYLLYSVVMSKLSGCLMFFLIVSFLLVGLYNMYFYSMVSHGKKYMYFNHIPFFDLSYYCGFFFFLLFYLFLLCMVDLIF